MNPINLYQQVADAYQAQGKYQERDRFLVLALDAANSAGQASLAEQLRQRILELNPNHLIKPYPNSATALQSPNFITYVSQLRKNFPPAKAQTLLQEMGTPAMARPKRTMIDDSSFPTADPVDDRKTPNWSQFQVDVKPKPVAGPSIGVVHAVAQEPATMSVNDPLESVPVTPPPVPFKMEPARRAPEPTRRPEIIPAPPSNSSRHSNEVVSPSGALIGNLLFVVLFLASIATLAYIFVLPFYPEVAKMLKPGG